MNNKFLNFILSLISIILMAGIMFFGWVIYDEFFSEKEPVVYKIDNIATEEPELEKDKRKITINESQSIFNDIQSSQTTIPTSTKTENQDLNSKYFYNQLTNNQKIIYMGLMNNKDNLKYGTYVIDFGDTFSDILKEENGSNVLGDDYQSAIEAFMYDNPEVFYLDVSKMYLNIETITKFFRTKYHVYISAAEGKTYLSQEFSDVAKTQEIINTVDNVKNNIINKLKGTDYQNIRYIHDYLVNSIEYDTDYQAIGSYNIYGALIEKKCVCEGYAKAFKYLANCAGIECEIMQGTATNSTGQTEKHAWNCVKLGENWYAIDPTWDDPIVIGGNGRATSEMKYRYFLRGSNSFERDHKLSYKFSDNGRDFSYPTLSKNDY